MIPFETIVQSLKTPRVIVEFGALARLTDLLPAGRILLITSTGFTRRGLTREILNNLPDRVVEVFDQVAPNPELEHLDKLAVKARTYAPNGLLAVGGGSVLDTAKVLSVLIPSPYSNPLRKTLREGEPGNWNESIPLLAVPTTSGTGAEATPFATVWDSATRQKYSLQDDRMFPQTVLLSPDMTLSLPSRETRHTGLDAISHALESLWNRNASDQTRTWAMESLERAVQALPKALAESDDIGARRTMQEASFLAGVAIRHTRTALAHAISYPLTLDFDIPHGLACSFTLSALLRHCEAARLTLGLSSDLKHALESLLGALAPEREVRDYARPDQIRALLPRMFSPSRSDNFVLPVDTNLVDHILRNSLNSD